MRRSSNQVNVGESADVPSRGWIARAYLWACERLYAELAGSYDLVSWLVSMGQWRRWQSGVWHEVRGQEILELGCGTGAMLVRGAQRGLKIVGIDRSPSMLRVAQRRLAREEGNSPLLLGDARALPMTGGRFDTVIATFPAGYALETSTLLEVKRVLRDEGRLVILGLWVELQVGTISPWFPVFYGRPSATSLCLIAQRVADVGFRTRWVEQREGVFTVGVLVADRE